MAALRGIGLIVVMMGIGQLNGHRQVLIAFPGMGVVMSSQRRENQHQYGEHGENVLEKYPASLASVLPMSLVHVVCPFLRSSIRLAEEATLILIKYL